MNTDRDLKPDNIMKPAADPRIVYGARCTWWDSIASVSTNTSGLPCCPHCGSVLFEVESELVWFTNIEAHVARSGDVDYRAFIEWLRGKCFPNHAVARLEFRIHEFFRAKKQRGELL